MHLPRQHIDNAAILIPVALATLAMMLALIVWTICRVREAEVEYTRPRDCPDWLAWVFWRYNSPQGRSSPPRTMLRLFGVEFWWSR